MKPAWGARLSACGVHLNDLASYFLLLKKRILSCQEEIKDILKN